MSRLRAAVIAIGLGFCAIASAQDYAFTAPASADDPRLPAAISDLAMRILPVYEEKDTERYLANLAALQMVSGNVEPAAETRRFLRERRAASGRHLRVPRVMFHDLQIRALAAAQATRTAYSEVYARALSETLASLDDRESHALGVLLSAPPVHSKDVLQAALDRVHGDSRLPQDRAFDLIWKFLAAEGYRQFADVVPAVIEQDRRRRYRYDDGLTLMSREGVALALRVVQPRGETQRRPTLLEFRIHAGPDEAAAGAAHGFVGVVATALRGPDELMPFRFDGQDARAVIDWIVAQPWSDGRVGMVGEGYSGFAAWAAAKRAPAALKAIATIDPMAPGIDFPAEGRVFRNDAFRWVLELAPAAPRWNAARWATIHHDWYTSGQAYRRFEKIVGQDNPIFRTWLAHPSYDRWWQKAIPFQQEFAALDLPVLTLLRAPGAQAGGLHYVSEHLRRRPTADHTLLIAAQESARLDAMAQLDLRELRLQWFGHVFRRSEKPAVLRDRVNLRVAGAQSWRHALSLAALAAEPQRLYLRAVAGRPTRELSLEADASAPPVELAVDLRDRGDASPSGAHDPQAHSLRFVSAPLTEPMALAGALRGQLDLWIDAMDVDLRIAAYEQLPAGGQIALFEPYVFRASYARDRTRRQLLRAGVRQTLPFEVERIVARQLARGSRIVLVLGVNKRPNHQINYGSGREVSSESRAQARRPLKMRWYGGSYIELPTQPTPSSRDPS